MYAYGKCLETTYNFVCVCGHCNTQAIICLSSVYRQTNTWVPGMTLDFDLIYHRLCHSVSTVTMIEAVSLNSALLVHAGRWHPVMTAPREENLTPRISKRSADRADNEVTEVVSLTCASYLLLCVFCVCQLFEDVSRENSQLQSQLQDTQRIISQTRLDLEKATQVTTQARWVVVVIFFTQRQKEEFQTKN